MTSTDNCVRMPECLRKYDIKRVELFIPRVNQNVTSEMIQQDICTRSWGSIWQHWNKGRTSRSQNTKDGWKTNFSAFRWAIPELCNFEGRAIYLDVDQILLKDIRQMWELPMNDCSYLSIRPERTDVMLLDCSKFNQPWWPSLKKMKPSGRSQKGYRVLVEKYTKVGPLDGIYNCLDGIGYSEDTRLVHYTEMNTQPWCPFPDTITYKVHPNEIMREIWNSSYKQAIVALD